MKSRARAVAAPLEWTVFKWSLMTAILFWVLVYKFSERGLKVPDFVYVNF
jgi:hypothetical protein